MNLKTFFNEKLAFPEIIGKVPNPSWINNYKAVCRASSATQCLIFSTALKKDTKYGWAGFADFFNSAAQWTLCTAHCALCKANCVHCEQCRADCVESRGQCN